MSMNPKIKKANMMVKSDQPVYAGKKGWRK
jgi:hypothetical protein